MIYRIRINNDNEYRSNRATEPQETMMNIMEIKYHRPPLKKISTYKE